MKIIRSKRQLDIHDIVFCETSIRDKAILAAVSSRDITKDMVRVRSSNVWSYAINVHKDKKYGDVYVQFKAYRGGPGDIYVYYDVPVTLYRRWVGAPSKGHFFWQYIRDSFQCAKLTGDKKLKRKKN